MYVICVFVCVIYFPYYLHVSRCVCVLFVSSFLYFSSYGNCIVYAFMYVYIFSYLVNQLEIWWLYLCPVKKKNKKTYIKSYSYSYLNYIWMDNDVVIIFNLMPSLYNIIPYISVVMMAPRFVLCCLALLLLSNFVDAVSGININININN